MIFAFAFKQIWKLNFCIPQMQTLTSFVTSLQIKNNTSHQCSDFYKFCSMSIEMDQSTMMGMSVNAVINWKQVGYNS